MECCLRIAGLQSNLDSVSDIRTHAEKSNDTTPLLSFFVKTKRLLQHTLSLEVLSPPFEEFWLTLTLNEGLESIKISQTTKHSRNLNSMCVTLNKVSNGIV